MFPSNRNNPFQIQTYTTDEDLQELAVTIELQNGNIIKALDEISSAVNEIIEERKEEAKEAVSLTEFNLLKKAVEDMGKDVNTAKSDILLRATTSSVNSLQSSFNAYAQEEAKWKEGFNPWKANLDLWQASVDTWKGTFDTWQSGLNSWRTSLDTWKQGFDTWETTVNKYIQDLQKDVTDIQADPILGVNLTTTLLPYALKLDVTNEITNKSNSDRNFTTDSLLVYPKTSVVDSKIAGLKNYTDTQFSKYDTRDTVISRINTLSGEVEAELTKYDKTTTIDLKLSAYKTIASLDTTLADYVKTADLDTYTPDLTGYATIDDLNAYTPDLSGYVTTELWDQLPNYYVSAISYMNDQNDLVKISNFDTIIYSKADVNNLLEGYPTMGFLTSDYITTNDTSAMISAAIANQTGVVKTGDLTETLSSYWAKADLDTSDFWSKQELLPSNYVLGTDLTTALQNYYNKTASDNNFLKIADFATIQLDYYIRSQVDSMFTDYYKKAEVEGLIDDIKISPYQWPAGFVENRDYLITGSYLEYRLPLILADYWRIDLQVAHQQDTEANFQLKSEMSSYYKKAEADLEFVSHAEQTSTITPINTSITNLQTNQTTLTTDLNILDNRLFSFDARRMLYISLGTIGSTSTTSWQTISASNYTCILGGFITSVQHRFVGSSKRTAFRINWTDPGYQLIPFITLRTGLDATNDMQNDYVFPFLGTMTTSSIEFQVEEKFDGMSTAAFGYVMFYRQSI